MFFVDRLIRRIPMSACLSVFVLQVLLITIYYLVPVNEINGAAIYQKGEFAMMNSNNFQVPIFIFFTNEETSLPTRKPHVNFTFTELRLRCVIEPNFLVTQKKIDAFIFSLKSNFVYAHSHVHAVEFANAFAHCDDLDNICFGDDQVFIPEFNPVKYENHITFDHNYFFAFLYIHQCKGNTLPKVNFMGVLVTAIVGKSIGRTYPNEIRKVGFDPKMYGL